MSNATLLADKMRVEISAPFFVITVVRLDGRYLSLAWKRIRSHSLARALSVSKNYSLFVLMPVIRAR